MLALTKYASAIVESNCIACSNDLIAEAYFVSANIYFSQKKYDLAHKNYLKADEINPYYQDNLNNLAFLYSETGKWNDAIIYYGKAISVHPTLYLYERRATCYTFLKNYSEAEKDYSNVLMMDPTLSEAYFNRGVCYFYEQKMEKACLDWKKASVLNYDKANGYISTYCK